MPILTVGGLALSMATFLLSCLFLLLLAAAQTRGDPHITTIDGLSYTFNGHGEYIAITSTDFELQVFVIFNYFFYVSIRNGMSHMTELSSLGLIILIKKSFLANL